MYYNCPACSGMKKPKIIKYFPPVTVKCVECGYEGSEEKFIRKKKYIQPFYFDLIAFSIFFSFFLIINNF